MIIAELRPDMKLYTYSEFLGMREFTVSHIKDNRTAMLFRNMEDEKELVIYDTQLELFFQTADEALIGYYKKSRKTLIDEIENYEKRLSRSNNKLKKMDEKFEYLKKKYPEEFI